MEVTVKPETISQAMRGDQTAIHQLYTDTRDYAYFVAKTYLKHNDKQVAAVLQDSYITAIGRLEDYSHLTSFTAWLHRIVAIKSAGVLRSSKVKFTTKDLVGDPHMTGELIPPSWVEQPDRRFEIMRIIGGLPDGQRMALMMYYLGGMPVGEIADVLGISGQEATSHLYNARQAIKMSVPAVEEKTDPFLDGRPLLAKLMDQEIAATSIPSEMARTVYQNVMMFFMTGGKVPKLETKAAKPEKSSGGFLSSVLPVIIMVILVVAFMVFYVVNYNRSQAKTAERLLAEYHQSKEEALAKGDSWPGVGDEEADNPEEDAEEGGGETSTLPAAQEEGEQPPDEGGQEEGEAPPEPS